MKKTSIAFLNIALLFFCVRVYGGEVTRLTGRVTCDDRDCILRLELTNASDKMIRTEDSFLPWGIRDSLTLVAFAKATDRHLTRSAAIDDLRHNRIAIPPGMTLRGDVSLKDRFPTLLAELKRGNKILLFWSYRLLTIDNTITERHFGGTAIGGDS